MRCAEAAGRTPARRPLSRYLPGLLALLFLFGEVAAVTGRVKGTVRDESGGPLAGVPVRLYAVETDRRQVFVTHTDSNGQYRFDTLQAGTYHLEVGGEQFQVQTKESIVVRPPFRNVIDFSLLLQPEGAAGSMRLARGFGDPPRRGSPDGTAAAPPPGGTPPPRPGPARIAVGFERDIETVRGSVAGGLKDSDGLGVPDARIILHGSARSYRTTSGADGTFRLTGVPVGRYNLEVRSPGFLSVFLPAVAVDSPTRLEFQLTLIEYPLDFQESIEDLLPPELPVPPSL
jgi:hypothetical protein